VQAKSEPQTFGTYVACPAAFANGTAAFYQPPGGETEARFAQNFFIVHRNTARSTSA